MSTITCCDHCRQPIAGPPARDYDNSTTGVRIIIAKGDYHLECWAAAITDHVERIERRGQVSPKGDITIDPDNAPWCIGCGAMTQEKCDCGPIADNN